MNKHMDFVKIERITFRHGKYVRCRIVYEELDGSYTVCYPYEDSAYRKEAKDLIPLTEFTELLYL